MESQEPIFQGTYTAIITPFKGEGGYEIDYGNLRTQLARQVEEGVHIVVCGTTGESPTLLEDEQKELIKYTVETVAELGGGVQVVAGVGCNDTRRAVLMSKCAAEYGADGLLVVSPAYNKPSDAGILDYFHQVANASSLPIMAYNVPGRTARNMPPGLVEQIAERNETVVALKEASGDFSQIQDIIYRLQDGRAGNFSVLSGDDAMTMGLMAVGAQGVVSVTSNLVPQRVKCVVDAMQFREVNIAMILHERLLPLHAAMFLPGESNPGPVKTAMKLMGLDNGICRSPVMPVVGENSVQLEQVLRGYNLI